MAGLVADDLEDRKRAPQQRIPAPLRTQHHELPGPGRGRDLRRRQLEDVVARRQPRVLQHHGCDVHHHRGKYSCCADQTREPAHGDNGGNGGIGGLGEEQVTLHSFLERSRLRENGLPQEPPVPSVFPVTSVCGFPGLTAMQRVRSSACATFAWRRTRWRSARWSRCTSRSSCCSSTRSCRSCPSRRRSGSSRCSRCTGSTSPSSSIS